MSRHTPGPWAVEDPLGPEQYSIVQDGLETYEWQFIAHIPVGTPAEGMMPRQEARANAYLIAAAPNLLKAAKRALAVLKAQGESVRPGSVTGALSAAIEKAEGRHV